MQPQSVPIFRSEALHHRANRLHGGVSLATPLAWQAISILLFATLVITVAFLTTATYSRVETVPGTVTLDKGVASIVSSRTGVISAVDVVEGQRVQVGQVLVRVRSEEDMIGGETAPSRIRAALGEQDARLAAQRGLLLAVSNAEQSRLREQILGLSGELDSLAHQIDEQRRLVDIAGADYESARQVASNGYISRRDLEERQAAAISRRQQLAQLEQLRAAKTASIAEARRTIVQSEASVQAQISNARSERAALTQQMAQADLAKGYSITSPVNGVVTALTARPGQPAADRQQLMMVIPTDAQQRVELYVPSAAAGFVKRGQSVRIAIDAFPYQQFGTLKARVTDVSAATVTRSAPNGPVPVYLVTAMLPRPWINAYGRRQPLAPGMTLVGRIVTENRSLIEWLFQPVFAVRNR